MSDQKTPGSSDQLNSKGEKRAVEEEIGSEPIPIDIETDQRLLRRIDWYLMPILCVTYSLQYWDKAILSQAAVFGLRQDLGLTDGLRYSWAGLILYFGHMVGMYPWTLLAQKFQPKPVCSALTIVWAIIVLTTPACTNISGILANRFFLGFVEAGVSPIFMLVISLWYKHEEQVMRTAVIYAFSAGSVLITTLISYGLAQITSGNLKQWKYMYFAAGAITFVWGISLLWVFPVTPQKAKGFTEEERIFLLERVRRNNAGSENNVFRWHQVREAVQEYQFWGIAIMGLLSSTGAATLTVFGSVVFAGMGFTPHTSLLLTMPIGLMALICILGSGYVGWRFNARLYTIAGSCIPVILGCTLLWQLPSSNRVGRIIGFYLISFFSSAWLQCVVLGTSNAAGYSKRSFYAAGTWIGYSLGNIMGPLLFDAKYAPRYNESFSAIMVCFAVLFVMALALRWSLARKNQHRDEIYGQPQWIHGLEDMTDRENKSFRWKL